MTSPIETSPRRRSGRRNTPWFGAVACAITFSACSSASNSPGLADVAGTSIPETTIPEVTTPEATLPATTSPATTTATSTTTTAPASTSPPTTVSTVLPDTVVPPIAPASAAAASLDLSADRLTIGTSVEGRPIIAERYGVAGGRRVLVIGVIHGNEDDGVAMIEQLRTRGTQDGVELWLVESMNPDGQAAQIRQNANHVDLNRNFPYKWGPIGEVGNSQYAGIGPASEPETQAMVGFISQLRPDIAIWYHQDANLVIPSTGRDGRIRARYAELTGLPIADCCDGGGVYTGIAATWARQELKQDSDAVAFIVELPGSLTAEQVTAHTDAVLTIAAEG